MAKTKKKNDPKKAAPQLPPPEIDQPTDKTVKSIIIKKVRALYKIRKIDQIILFDDIHGNAYLQIEKIIEGIKDSDKKEIDIVLHSSGGSAEYAYRIIKMLRERFLKVNIVIPFWAKSAATLLSLGGSLIIMTESSEMGPLDAQIVEENKDEATSERESVLTDESSLANLEERSSQLFRKTYAEAVMNFSGTPLGLNKTELSEQVLKFVASFYEPLIKQIDPYKMGRKRRITQIAIKYIDKISNQYNPIKYVKEFEKFIVYDCPNHGFIVDYHSVMKYLRNLILAKSVSNEYAEKLQDLSNYLIEYRITVEESVTGKSVESMVMLVSAEEEVPNPAGGS